MGNDGLMEKTLISEFNKHDWEDTEEMLKNTGLDYNLDKTGSIEVNGKKFVYMEDLDDYLIENNYL
jgi:hypothetical protein